MRDDAQGYARAKIITRAEMRRRHQMQSRGFEKELKSTRPAARVLMQAALTASKLPKVTTNR
jgi:hypothetical protein